MQCLPQVLGRDGSGSAAAILEGLQFTYNQFTAKMQGGKRPKMVVNMSLGANFVIQSLDDAIKQMSDDGMIIVVAAGK